MCSSLLSTPWFYEYIVTGVCGLHRVPLTYTRTMSQKVLPSKIGFNPNGTRTPAGARVSLVPSHHATLKSFSGFRAGAPLCSPAVVGSASPTVARRSRALQPVRALFEKFTERSIKSVMLAQEMSRTCGAMEVI